MSVKEEVYARLNREQIPYTAYEHEAVNTMEACVALPFVDSDVLFCKNILLCNRQKTDFYLYLAPPFLPFRTAVVSKKLQVARLSFAPADLLPELLHLESGSLSPFGLWWDKEHKITLVTDTALRAAPRLAFHPCDHTATVLVDTETFYHRIIPSLGALHLELNGAAATEPMA